MLDNNRYLDPKRQKLIGVTVMVMVMVKKAARMMVMMPLMVIF